MKLISQVAMSNLFTMGVVAEADPRRAIPADYEIPNQQTRELRARLILEEALESIHALGFDVKIERGPISSHINIETIDVLSFVSNRTPDLEGIIDGCCDTIYVATGTLCAIGAPDIPHMNEVCKANDAKFPDCKAILNEHGKFQKPAGWKPPDHIPIINRHPTSLKAQSDYIVSLRRIALKK